MSGADRRLLGRWGEALAAEELRRRGYRVVAAGWRCRYGEIDLIALYDRYLVFVEVKYRKDEKKGWPQEAVDWHKQQVISRVADYYMFHHPEYHNYQIRFDVAAVLGTKWKLYEHAFEYQGGKRWN